MLGLLAAVAIATLPASAQTGGLEVRVLDAADGTPLPGAVVTLSSEQGRVATTAARTDADGRVLFPVLRVGAGYVVMVEMPGFATFRDRALRIGTDRVEAYTVQLTPEFEERIEARAERGVIDLDETGRTSRFRAEFIENLPVPGRFYQNLLTLAPGVQDRDGDGNPNVHGARTRDFRAEVGGVSNVDPLTGEWLSYVATDSIEELQMIPSGAGVEFGRAAGGFARILQRQGSNDFEGIASVGVRSNGSTAVAHRHRRRRRHRCCWSSSPRQSRTRTMLQRTIRA